MGPLVSVVIPIYNVEKYIKKCVDTIVNQTYKNLEIILVDDGSPDNSGYIADSYASSDHRIKVVHKKNGGLSDARNTGMEISNGDYICFVDSDDYIELDMIEKVLEKALTTDSDVILFGLYNEVLDEHEEIIEQERVFIDNANLQLMTSVIGYAWNKLYKSAFLKSKNFAFQKSLSLIEDIIFNEKIFLNANKIEYLKDPLYHYINRNRPTLVKKYYEDSYKLHKMGFQARRNVVLKLFGENYLTKEILSNSYIGGIRYCCSNMFYFKNDLSLESKYRKIRLMVNDVDTIEQIKYYNPINVSDQILKLCILYKSPILLSTIYLIRSIGILKRKKQVN